MISLAINFTNPHDIKSYALIQIGIYIILTGLNRGEEMLHHNGPGNWGAAYIAL